MSARERERERVGRERERVGRERSSIIVQTLAAQSIVRARQDRVQVNWAWVVQFPSEVKYKI